MPQTIDIPDVGEVDFPDGMSDADITDAIRTKILPKYRAPRSADAVPVVAPTEQPTRNGRTAAEWKQFQDDAAKEAESETAKAALYDTLAQQTQNLNPAIGIPNVITGALRGMGIPETAAPNITPEIAAETPLMELPDLKDVRPDSTLGKVALGGYDAFRGLFHGATTANMIPGVIAGGAAGVAKAVTPLAKIGFRALQAGVAGMMTSEMAPTFQHAGEETAKAEAALAAGEPVDTRALAEAYANAGAVTAIATHPLAIEGMELMARNPANRLSREQKQRLARDVENQSRMGGVPTSVDRSGKRPRKSAVLEERERGPWPEESQPAPPAAPNISPLPLAAEALKELEGKTPNETETSKSPTVSERVAKDLAEEREAAAGGDPGEQRQADGDGLGGLVAPEPAPILSARPTEELPAKADATLPEAKLTPPEVIPEPKAEAPLVEGDVISKPNQEAPNAITKPTDKLPSTPEGGLLIEPSGVSPKPPPVEPVTAPAEPAGRNPDTGIKQSSITAQRAERGDEPLTRGERQTWQAANEAAKARIAQDSTWLDTVQKEITDSPRPLDLTEIAGMEIRMSEMRQRYELASDQMAAAFKAENFDLSNSLFQSVQDIGNQLRATEKAVGIGSSASEAGRRLGGLRMMTAEDFSLAAMERQWRDNHAGREPNRDEFLELKADHDRLNAALEKSQKNEAAATEAAARFEANAALAEVKLAAAQQPSVPPWIQNVVDRIGSGIKARAAKSREALKGKFLSPTPEDLIHLVNIGVDNIYTLGENFARWSKAMIEATGPKIEPFLKDIFEASKKEIRAASDRVLDKIEKETSRKVKDREAVKKTITGETSAERKADITEKIGEKFKSGETGDITPLVQKLAREFVESGIVEREPLLDALHDALKTIDPEISRRTVQDAFTGYGKFTRPRTDQVSKILADLKGQALETGKIFDLEARKPLKKTGFQRGALSDVRRRLVAAVNEAKRRFGIVVSDPATQLKSALDARKTARRNQITDLEEQIKSRTKFNKDRTPPPSDPELEGLTKRVTELRQEFNEIFGDPTQSPENQLKRATAIAERTQAAWEQRLKNAKAGNFGPLDKPTKPEVKGPKLEAIRARTEAMRQEVKELKAIANPKLSPEARALQSYNTRLANETARYREKLAAGDYSPPTKRKPFDITTDAPTMKAKAELENLKNEWNRKGAEARLAAKRGFAKAADRALEAMNLSRNVMTAYDLSALRQAAFQMFNVFRARENFKAIGAMVRALSKESADTQWQQIQNRKNATNGAYNVAKLRLVDPNETNIKAQDETIRGRWAAKVPGVAASNRAFLTLLNRVRADSFDAMMEASLNKSGEAMRATGDFVNDATGYGHVSNAKLAQKVDALGALLWSPRLLTSRFRLLTGSSFAKAPAAVKLQIAKSYAGTLIGMYSMYQLAQMAGFEVEDDPRSADFGKLKDGNVRLDPMGGLLQVTVLMNRLATGEKKVLRTGKIQEQQVGEELLRFMRTKIRPELGLAWDIKEGKNMVGEPVTLESVAQTLLVPLSLRDISNVMEEAGIPKGTAYQILSLFGVGLQSYDSSAARR